MFKEMKEKVLHRQLSKYMEENKNLRSENADLQARIVAMQALVENAKDYINSNEKMRREMLTAIKRLEEIEKMENDGLFEVLPKKEVIGLRKEYEKKMNKILK